MGMLQRFRVRLGDRISALFSHGETPLENTADYPGDAGLCGPDSISWRVIGDVSVFLGAIRALLIQATHPETVAGVDDHSRYRADPMGRLNRTAFYVTSATFGAMPEVEEAVKRVRAAHRPVKGVSHRGLPYSASDPALAAWVHNTLTDSFLVAYQQFGLPLSEAEADRFVVEQSRIGAMLGADPLPQTAAGLRDWVRFHPDLATSPGQEAAVHFLRRPPLPFRQRLGYAVLFQGAIATMPPELTRLLDMKPRHGARRASAGLLRSLRFGLLDSPSWQAALERCGASYDSSRFRLTA
ncbi:MAG: oxygenase MpaB family protein [Acidimicrobiaceae bacterium]|nr:oxygenase MpaB family protein [Acidimicrobiaceae bacterium]MCY4175873.1 oxygenase MpaB family protein [Acidimicrobiaceae bacterium]MCY4280587.1 oxygenase MpaB family protein [Acidimicrobiaceae bacterium]MCY4293343.1 oxygenase MpaB family protein [Acidimicrobiaceae bacterium]